VPTGRGGADRPRDRLGRPLPRGSRTELEPGDVARLSTGESARRGIVLFDAGRFFEAHEHFERVWRSRETADADRAFWKGVTQVAVGCCHLQRGNGGGAVRLLRRAAGYLKHYPATHRGVDTAALIGICRDLARRIESGVGSRPTFPRFPRPGHLSSR
jgi:hypothetical protein